MLKVLILSLSLPCVLDLQKYHIQIHPKSKTASEINVYLACVIRAPMHIVKCTNTPIKYMICGPISCGIVTKYTTFLCV